ncbi:Histone H2AX [Hordeum vulgare]|nr:Histone H2AX [Hordeum vulgare]
MNGTDTQMSPEAYCNLLREAVKNGRAHVYALYASSEIFKAFNINGTDAICLSSIAPSPRTSTTALLRELADIVARDNKRARITPCHIELAVCNDYELDEVMESVLISSGGVRPDIDTELFYNMVKAKGSA